MGSLATGHWHAVFGDLRFVMTDQNVAQKIQEHVDFVVPESALELPIVQKMLELLKSENYRKELSLRVALQLP